MRRAFFGAEGDTTWNLLRLQEECPRFEHNDIDVRSRGEVQELVRSTRPDLIVHSAAQPSHDLAASRPFEDFEVNANGTLNLLEALRTEAPEAVFVLLSTNKVYGDRPNQLELVELPTRWDYADPALAHGIDETMSIDQSLHSLFGVSKAAADLLAQEYGRYFGLRTVALRCGCITGPCHSGVVLHGFLSYLVRCNLEGRNYQVFGYLGKQVRDNIHADDLATCVELLFDRPAPPGSVFNLGGGRQNSISILEAFERVSALTGRPMDFTYVDAARKGDHVCYVSDLRRLQAALPQWGQEYDLDRMFEEIVAAWRDRLGS